MAIVPARNEQARVGDTVRALLDGAVDEVIVVDDASTDGTSTRAAEAGGHVVALGARAGKAGAVAAGLSHVTGNDPDLPIVVLIDADLGSSASIARELIAVITAGDADLVIGGPPREGASGFGLVERAARAGVRLLSGRRFDRPLSGQRAARLDVLRAVRLAPRFGMEVSMTIDAVRLGYAVRETSVRFTHARTGRDARGFAHRARQGIDILRALAICAAHPRRKAVSCAPSP